MALQVTSQGPTARENIGTYSGFITGIAGGSGTTTTVTVPQLTTVHGVVPANASSATAPYCDTTSGNQFTVTHGSGDSFHYIAWGVPKM